MLTVLTELVAINVYAIMVILEMDHNVVSCPRLEIDTNTHIIRSLYCFKPFNFQMVGLYDLVRTSHVVYQIW